MTPVSPTFDLVHEPWIPCRERDGTVTEQGILCTLGRAHELAGLSGDVPTQTFALTRLLLAVLHGALAGPRDLDDWEELWRAEKLPVARIAPYLTQYRDRFDLFHPETPFLQVADLHTAKGETSELSKLIADVPNGVPFFTTRQGGDLDALLRRGRALAGALPRLRPVGDQVRCGRRQAGQGRQGLPDRGRRGAGCSGDCCCEGRDAEGDTAAQPRRRRLLAVRTRADDGPAGVGAAPVTAAEELPGGRPPTGPVDLYLWQSRRVRLVAADGRVTSVLICERREAHPAEHAAPRAAHRVATQRGTGEEAGRDRHGLHAPRARPRPGHLARAGVAPAGTSSRQKAEGGRYLAPGVVEWLSHLSVVERRIPPDHQVRMRAIGMVVRLEQLRHRRHRGRRARAAGNTRPSGRPSISPDAAVSRVRAAESAARAVGGLAGDLAAAAGGSGEGPRSRTMEQVYAQLDGPFRRWLLTVGDETDETVLKATWQETARSVVRGMADELLENIPPACWEGRVVRKQANFTAAHAERQYWKALRDALPYAFRENETDAA